MPRKLRYDAHSRDRAAEALANALMDRYVDWREACALVEAAYRRWSDAAGESLALMHARYVYALDLEARAAAAYAELVELVPAARATPEAA
jgi:malonyl CoA-acyl carrier protein transacylase